MVVVTDRVILLKLIFKYFEAINENKATEW